MDATVKPAAVLGLDEGKRSHWACLLAADGEIPANRSVANREPDLADLFGAAPSGTLVVVDQVRNIGDLPIRMARKAGLDVAYLSGIAEHNAAKLLHGDSKTDERDAPAIAKTALGMPSALLPCPDEGEAVAAALDPSLVTTFGFNLQVDLEGPFRGRTIGDRSRLQDPDKHTQVALGVNVPEFLDRFMGRVTAAAR